MPATTTVTPAGSPIPRRATAASVPRRWWRRGGARRPSHVYRKQREELERRNIDNRLVPDRGLLPWFWRARATTAAFWIGNGLTKLLGPARWRSSPSYQVISRFMPLRMWAVMFVLIGMLIAAPLIIDSFPADASMIVGAAVSAAWAVSFVTAGLVGQLVGGDGPWLWGFIAAAHVFQTGLPLPHRTP